MIYRELAATGTFTLKTGAGYLNNVVVNIPATGTIQIFDNVSATAPAIAGASAFALPPAGSVLNYQAHFNTGLTIVIGGTPGSVTVSYT